MPSATARSASAATIRVPSPCRCQASATMIARSAVQAPGAREYWATPITSPPATAATAARSCWSTRKTELVNCSTREIGLKNRR